jgi:serine O-acetyltransferase
VIYHGVGIVIGKNVKSEEKLTVYQNVTLGGTGNKKETAYGFISQPHIKNNVIIYANAICIGPIVVGENSRIAAGAVLLTDAEPNSTYAGVPAKRINKTRLPG